MISISPRFGWGWHTATDRQHLFLFGFAAAQVDFYPTRLQLCPAKFDPRRSVNWYIWCWCRNKQYWSTTNTHHHTCLPIGSSLFLSFFLPINHSSSPCFWGHRTTFTCTLTGKYGDQFQPASSSVSPCAGQYSTTVRPSFSSPRPSHPTRTPPILTHHVHYSPSPSYGGIPDSRRCALHR